MKTFKEILNEITNNIQYRILNNDEMKDFLYDNGVPKNKDVYFNKNIFHYFGEDGEKSKWNAMPFRWYSLWVNNPSGDGEMVAVAKVGQYPTDSHDSRSLAYIDVDSRYRQQGLARELTGQMFKNFADNKWTFRTSSYSDIGLNYIKPLFNELAKKYKIKFIDVERYMPIIKDYRENKFN